MVDLARIYLFVFGVLTIAGGVLGFVKAKSRASLIAGTVSGLLLLAAGWMTTSEQKNGPILGLVVSLALAARFGNAYRKTKKAMPALPMTVLGIAGIVVTALALAR